MPQQELRAAAKALDLGACGEVTIIVSLNSVINWVVTFPRRLGASAALVLAGLLIMQLPELLANEGNLHALRSIGLQAFVFSLAGLAVASALRWAQSWSRIMRLLVSAVLAIALGAAAALNTQALFGTDS